MAREFIDGFESGDISLWTGTAVTATSASNNMDGAYCLHIANTYVYRSVTDRDAYYGGFWYSATRNAVYTTIKFMNGATVLGTLYNNGENNYIEIYRGDNATQLAVGVTQIAANTVYKIEFYYSPKTDGTGRFIVKINGVSEIDYTGQTSNNASQINKVYVYGGGYDFYVDNFILDSSSYPGDSRIQAIVPTGAGTTTGYTPSTGANWSCVDDVPYSDTDYIYTNTPDAIDSYVTSNISGSIGSIQTVQVQLRAKYEGSPAVPNIAPLVRSGGTDYVGSNQALGAAYAPVLNIWETDPATGVAWTESGVNAVEIGVKARA